MAQLDLKYYQGGDRYSDGDETENRLLQIVQEGKTLDDMALEDVSWPILYHLHPVRENICNWYPFRPGSRILEIGAGCGAVTGALCRSGCEVYSVDLSKRRSTINYERHHEYDNLHILAGNLNDMAFDEPFDYVLLIGVLEYAGRFTEGENAYRTFLENIRRLMKPDGCLLIAIENRLGLKYFAGAREDHLGKPFAGINGYEPDEGVRTFSRTELQTLLRESGYNNVQFYYPYPDYKFPLEIFSEQEINSGRYGKTYYPVDEPRSALFSEADVSRTMTAEGVAGVFANSFFAEAFPTVAEDPNQILYVKLNNDRKDCFRIGTMIRKAGENTEVIKYPLNEKAEEHIRTIQQNEEMIGRESVLQGQETPEGLVYPFITDPTADALLEKYLKTGDREGILRLLDDVYRLASIHPEEKAYSSRQFSDWFGEERTARDNMPCVQPANIDMILDNIFLRNRTYMMLDCEWVADFPVPLAFVMWRILVSALYYHPDLEKKIAKDTLFARYQILPEDEPVYSAWSGYFETKYVGNNSLSRFSKGIRIVEFDQNRMDYQQARIQQLEKIEAGLRQQIFDQEKTAKEMQWQVEYGTARIGQLEETEKVLREENSRISEELQGIYNSRSWKLTEKIRRIGSIFKTTGKK